MAGNYTIDVNVALKAQQANIKGLRKQIEQEFSEVDFNSSIGKKLTQLFNQFDTKISDMDSILGKGILNASDLNRLGTVFDRISLIIGQMRSNVSKAPLLDLGIDPSQIPELVAATEELRKLQAQANKAKGKSTKDRLTETGQKDLLDKVNKLNVSDVSEDKSLSENTKALEKELQKRQALLEQYENRSVELEAEKQHKLGEQQQKQAMSRKALDDAWKMERDAHGKAAIEKTPIRKLGTRADAQTFKQQKENIQNFVGQVFDEAIVDFGSTMDSGSLTHALLSSLFSPDEIDSMAQYTSDQFKQAFEEKLFNQNGKAVNQDNLKKFMGSAEDWVKANPMTSAQMSAQGNVLRAAAINYQNEAAQAGLEAQGAETEFQNNEVLIQSLHTQISAFGAIVNELAQATAEFNQSVNALYKDAIKEKNDEIKQIGQNKRNDSFPSVQPGNPALTRQNTDEALNGLNATRDADAFQSNLKSAISQWMGAREIIGYVKQGIREAYQDIQGLDKAMTNIAVVTDMSVSDLWGKIDEYMGVAKQYGVTTQGVYEVSQLYFQQGLGEADTMAATTETLKMARIAGMDYAEAADGMTVAIRGFNMEMQDAAHVTDVYSKVAAITASDTQELVTAMSKTASSAAAVGSSFENTTAMLAVMIEATRESPQNLGSALKSIISRYGEMTKGLSEDSEGEEIDYNRVDTALKTVGISLKDAQGQFRDFDTVIEELSAKWDTLDSVTQRYIATIFAGNRQQSRFLALVSNYDRYMEVSEAAANSEDAGLLQYSKTLDSLETKLNNIKTGFQQFYMDIFNGPVIGKVLDFINELITGFNKLGKFQSLLSMGSIIAGIKAMVSLIIQPFGRIASVIAQAIKDGFNRGRAAAVEGAEDVVSGAREGADRGSSRLQRFGNYVSDFNSRYGGLIQGAEVVGGIASAAGVRVGAENARWGTAISGVGNTLSYAAMGAQIGGIYGAVAGALVGIVTTIASWPSDLEMAQQKLEKAQEKAEKAQIERAQARERETGLEDTINKLNELKKHQYDSAEAQEEFIKANNEAFEKFPDLAVTFDEFGNAFIDIQSAEQALALAREATATATLNATRAELERIRQERETNKLEQKEHLEKAASRYSRGWSDLEVSDDFTSRIASQGEQIVSISNYRTASGGTPYWEVMDERIQNARIMAEQQARQELGLGPQDRADWSQQRTINSAMADAERAARADQANIADAQDAYYDSVFNSAIEDYLVTERGGQQTTDFVTELLGDRLVTQNEAQLYRDSGAKANTFTTISYDEFGNAIRTYEQIADASLEFIMRGADSLDLTDSATTDFLVSLSNMSDQTEALNAIFTNYSQLKFKEGINSTEFLAGYFNYDLNDPEQSAAFFEMLGDNATFNSKEAGYDYAISSMKGQQVASNVNAIIDQNESLKTAFSNITGLREFVQQKAVEQTEGLGENARLDMAETSGLISDALLWAEQFSQRAETINADEEVSGLFESAKSGKISKVNLVEQLHTLGFNTEIDPYLQEYVDSIYESVEETKNNIITSLHESPITWTTHVTSRDVTGQVDIDNLLNEIAPNYYSAITDFKNYLVESIDSGKMSIPQANQMAREFISVWQATTDLPAEQIAQAQQILSEADLTTTLGKEDLKSKLSEAGIEDANLTTWIDGFYPYAENLITQYGVLQDKLISGLETITQILQNASEGASFEDAAAMAKKVGKDVTELFNFQNGQYFAKDENALQQIYEAYNRSQADAINESLENQLNILSEQGTLLETRTEHTVSRNPNAGQPGEPLYISETQEVPIYGFSQEYYDLMDQYKESALAWFDSLDEESRIAEGLSNQPTDTEVVSAYLKDYAADVQDAIKAETEWQYNQAKKALLINNRTHELESSGVGMDRREAFSLLSSKGKTGYSANEIAQLETYLGVGAGGLGAVETGIGTGEYEIDLATLGGRGIPLWVQNAIQGIVEENLISASEAIQDLGSQTAQLGGPEKGVFAAAFEKSANVLGRDFVEEYYPMMIESTVSGTMDYSDQLKRIIAKELGTDVSSPEVQEAYRGLISSYKDGTVEAQKEVIDLQLKALDGSITQAEVDTLADEGIDASGLIEKTQEAINSLVQQIVSNANISFDDKVSNLKQIYDTQLNDILGEETSIASSLASREAISRSDVSSMLAELSALGVAGIAEFTESADGTGYYLENQADILARLNAVIQSADDGSMQKKTAQNLVNQIEYMQEWQSEELPDSLASTAETLAQATKVTAIDVRDFYKELTGRDISLDNAKTLAREITELDPVSRLQAFVDIAASQGIEIDPERIQELANTLLDTIIDSIASGVSALGSGLEGSLSFSDFQNLANKYNITGEASRSSTGVKLTSSQQQQLVTGLYKEAASQGMLTGFGDQLWETFRDSNNDPYVGYNAIEEEIANQRQQAERLRREAQQQQQAIYADENLIAQLSSPILTEREAAREAITAAEALAEETQQAAENAQLYAQALEQARAAAMLDPDAYEFNFMEQDATDGYTQNFDNFVAQIDKVKTVFSTFQSGEAIGYQDFANMMDMMNASIGRVGNAIDGTVDNEIYPGLAKMQQVFNEAEGGYEGFVNSVIAHTDEWGKVDIEGVALEMGISVDAAMEAMSEGMAEGLKEVAKQQIQYLSGVEKMLLAMQALEGVGEVNLSLGLDFTASNGDEFTLYNIKDYWEEILNLDESKRFQLEVAVTTKLGELRDAGLQGFFEEFGFGEGFDFMTMFFGEDGFDITSELDTSMADMFGTMAKVIPELTSGQYETFARDMYAALGEESFQWADTNGDGAMDQITGVMMDSFYSNMTQFLSTYDFNNIRESVMSQFETAFATSTASGEPFTIEYGADSVQIVMTDIGYQIEAPEGFDVNNQEFRDALARAIGVEEINEIVLDEETGAIVSINGQPVVNEAENVNRSFATAAAAADALDEAIANIANTASSFQAGEQFGTLAEQLRAGAAAARELMSAFTGQEIEPPDVTVLEAELTAAQAAFDALAASSVPTSELDAARQRVTDIQTQLSSLQAPTGVTSGLIGELTNAIDIANRLSDALASNNGTPLEVNFNVDEANNNVTVLIASLLQLNAVFSPTVKIQDEATEVLNSIIDLIASVSSKTVTITTIHRTMYTSSGSRVSASSGVTPSRPQALEQWTGSVNNITGPAYKDGSIGRLATGAQLANKTLIGELGPELAVYDGQYHLLGQTGAEFVKLPKDAIVFNHLQTEGILSGQMKDARGKPVLPGSAMVTGNVVGPAAASGIGAALSAVRRAKSVWEGLLNSLSAADLMGGGGGGGGGGGDESLKAHIADLQEWYNLSRQIADIEGQINVLLAKRKNITDGHEYLKNLRETQRLLDDQVNTQQDLLRFQQLQLQRQASHINTHDIWSQFLEVDENGLLQYKEGNETNGGKGALEILQQMNEMSGEEQTAFLAKLGYSYTDTDGNVLEGSELVAKFYEELQKQIDDYDALRDTVQEAESALEDLEAEIAEIEKEIRQNEIDLSQEIYDIIVDAWKENIENLKEQNDLIKEANEAYANGIQEAIDAERKMYEQNTAIADREKLQRQLALMRRSGGSAAEIADLEKQLDSMFQDEYFSNQEDALENIREANENQAKALDQQVKIQEELLEYQQENGVIWQKVYEIMSGTDAEIIDFMTGNSTNFFEQSALQQEDMLTEWAKKVGIFTAERERQYYAEEGLKSFEASWNTEEGKSLQDSFNKASEADQEEWKREFGDTYASAIISGKSPKEAIEMAQEELFEHIKNWMKAQADSGNKYARGGIIDYTGPAWVDGSKSKPERILSAEQNKILEEGLAMAAGRSETLKEAFNSFASNLDASIRSSIANIINNTTENRGINIESGAIVLQVQQLNDQYDIDELYNDITNKVYSIAARASGRSVNRR